MDDLDISLDDLLADNGLTDIMSDTGDNIDNMNAENANTEQQNSSNNGNDITSSNPPASTADDGSISFDTLMAASQATQAKADAEAAQRETAGTEAGQTKKKRKRHKKKTAADNEAAINTAVNNAAINQQQLIENPAAMLNDSSNGSAMPETQSITMDTEEIGLPQWALSIASKRNASVSHSFLLYGNVRDYMVRRVSIRDGLIGMLDPQQTAFDIIATYDQASGLQFNLGDRYKAVPAEEYRKRFINLMHQVQAEHQKPQTEDIPQDPCELFQIIASIFDMPVEANQPSKMLLFVDFLELLVPDGASAQLRDSDKKLAITIADLCRSYTADAGGSCVFFFTDALSQVNSIVRDTSSRIDQIDIPQPRLEERRDFVENVLDVPENSLSDGRQVLHCEEGVTPEYLAINTAGLACYQIEDIVLRCVADDTPVTEQSVKERKNEIIKNDYHDVIEIMDPKYGFDGIGGMEIQKRFFTDEVINPIRSGDLAAVPMGVLLSGAPGTSKPIYSATPIWRVKHGTYMIPELVTFADLEIGDYVYNRYGDPCRVLNVYDRGLKDAYQVVLKDGRQIVCSADHVWGTKALTESYLHERTVQDMLDGGIMLDRSQEKGERHHTAHYYIPMNNAVQFPEIQYDIDPYVMGCFIGDGCCTNKRLTISSADEELVAEIAKLIHANKYAKLEHSYSWTFYVDTQTLTDIYDNSVKFGCEPWKGHGTKEFNSIYTQRFFAKYKNEICCNANNKCIPYEYKVGSIEQRFALIQGLLDTDGCFHKDELGQFRGNISFSTTSTQLAHDIRDVLFSLGISSTLSAHDRRGQIYHTHGKDYIRKSVEYRVNINCPNNIKPQLFRLSRKKNRAEAVKDIVKGHNYDYIPIVDIKKLGKQVPMRCITVNMPDGLFLGGEDFVVCHNTMFSKAVAKESGMNCVALNMNNIYDKYVGNSEKNLDRALECAMAMAPTILFIDEIDEALPKRHTGEVSGVSNRINKTMLTFLSDTSHRGKVIVLAATNYPEQVDSAMKRAGRFDKRIPFFAPTGYDRVRIIKIECQKAADVNINGDNEPYLMSCLKSPDEEMNNPFNIEAWLVAGGIPDENYVGDKVLYQYMLTDRYGVERREEREIPKVLDNIMHKDRITLQEFYRALFSIFTLPEKDVSRSTNIIESDSAYYERIKKMLNEQSLLFNNNATTIEIVLRYIIYYKKCYSVFMKNTDHMTGAELDVVVQKAITLFRRWKKENPEQQQDQLRKGMLKSYKDIPWEVINEACMKTTYATTNIKSMEDNALLDASDLDFIPDAIYGRRGNNEEITYKQRLEELRNQQMNA